MSPASQPRLHGFEKNRLEALIDGVFAVVLTLLVLDLKLPENIAFASNDDLWQHLLGLERHFVIYVISFVVIAMYWINHQVQFHFVVRTDRTLIWINFGYLLLVSFLPFATDLIGDHKDLMLPCEIYGVTLLALSAASFVHLRYLATSRARVAGAYAAGQAGDRPAHRAVRGSSAHLDARRDDEYARGRLCLRVARRIAFPAGARRFADRCDGRRHRYFDAGLSRVPRCTARPRYRIFIRYEGSRRDVQSGQLLPHGYARAV